MKDKKNKKRIEELQTPIIDGDARPDKFVDPDFSQGRGDKVRDEKKVTSNRAGDENSLEDYKDEK